MSHADKFFVHDLLPTQEVNEEIAYSGEVTSLLKCHEIHLIVAARIAGIAISKWRDN